MERYTASYGKIKNSFVFQNIDGNHVHNQYYGILCVLKNILQRGNPTFPSKYLQKAIGRSKTFNHSFDWLVLISLERTKWSNTIKGNVAANDYPAESFFYNILPRYFNEYPAICQLTLPEALLEDMVPNCSENFYKQKVDFYIPQAKLVIEIDGEQHNDKLQKRRDIERDQYLEKHGIEVVRIESRLIRTQDKVFSERLNDIKKHLRNSTEFQAYQDIFFDENYYDSHKLRIEYDTVLRFQILILSLLQKGKIDLTDRIWKVHLVNSNKRLKELIEIAYKDTLLWLKHLCQLSKLDFQSPLLQFTENRSEEYLNFDFDMYKRWNDEYLNSPDVVYIRNDYYDNDYFYVNTTEPIKYSISTDNDILSTHFILENLFGYSEFNEGQLAIIVQALNNIDTIGILPTGSGKSLCYQFCCLLQPAINFVVCPILALIYDQKDNFDEFGINRTSYITSDKEAEEKEQVISEYGLGKYFVIWISPERFQTQKFRNSLQMISQKKSFAYAVIDEVHCLSEWGHDFRTSYLNLIKTIREYCNGVTLLGLTATASQFVLEDLKKEFSVDSTAIKSVASMNRDELRFHVVKTAEKSKYDQLRQVLEEVNSKYEQEIFISQGNDSICGTIFTINKGGESGCIKIASKLEKDLGATVKAYHGDLGPAKEVLQKEYRNNIFTLLAATKSFGMGVNKKNIRYTIHYGLPWSIESFYQEAGRAGRDRDKSKKSDCYIIYQPERVETQVINKLFELNVTIPEIQEESEKLKYDLGSIMYLWKFNNLGVETDLNVMRWVMNELSRTQSNVLFCNEEKPKSIVEKAVYRLTILGLIEDWTIEDWGEHNGKIKVYKNEDTIEIDGVHQNLLEYIRRYDRNFSFDDTNNRYTKYMKYLKDESLKEYTRYMKVLLQWSYDNIVYNRLQTIKNMMVLCDTYKDSQTLQAYISNYFRFSDVTILLDNITYNPDKYSLWFELFYTYETVDEYHSQKLLITASGAEAALASLQRYLESYKFNVGLNFISGILRLLCNQFEESDGMERLSDAFSVVDTFENEKVNEILQQTLDIGEYMEKENKEILGSFLANRYSDKASIIYKKMRDRTSLTISLEQFVNRLNRVEENAKW